MGAINVTPGSAPPVRVSCDAVRAQVVDAGLQRLSVGPWVFSLAAPPHQRDPVRALLAGETSMEARPGLVRSQVPDVETVACATNANDVSAPKVTAFDGSTEAPANGGELPCVELKVPSTRIWILVRSVLPREFVDERK